MMGATSLMFTAPAGAQMTITDSGASAPTSSIFVSATNNNSNTRVSNNVANGDLDRGQSFITPDTGDANTQWGLTAITLQLRDIESLSANPVMNLQVVNWGPNTQTGDPGSVIYNQSAAFPMGLDNEDYFTFNLGTTIALNENANYGFLVSFDSSGDSIRPRVGNGAQALYSDGALWAGGTSMTTLQDMTFYLVGSVIGGASDTDPPVWAATYPKVDTETADGFTVRAQIDEAGTAHYVVLADGAGAPTSAQVKLGQDSTGTPVLPSGSIVLAANTENSAAVTGLADTTSYDVYLVAEDDEGTPNVQLAPVKVDVSTLAPDTTPPTWTATYPKVDTPSENGFTVRASIVGEAGTAYYVVVANGASAPTGAQIKAGNDSGDAPALKSGSLILTADTENDAVVTGLAAATDFDVHVVAEDSVLNLTIPVAIDIATLPIDSTAPTWTSGYPLVDTVTSSGFTVRASINEDGTAYYVVVADGASAPSAAQIKAGTDAGDATALASGSFSLSASTENSQVVTSLSEGTAYDIYIVAEDGALAQNTTAPELREATTPTSTLTVVGNIQWNDNGDRTVSVFPGNSSIDALLGGAGTPVDPAVPVNQDLGTVEAYHFVNSDEANPDAIQSYATSGGRISLPTTADTGLLNTNRCATAVFTTSDPTGGIPDLSGSVTTVSGISGSVDGTIDVTGLASGSLYFIIGSGGAEGRATSLTVTQGPSTVVTAQSGGGYYQDGGTGFWANADTIAACVEVSFTNDGSNNSVSYSWDQNGAGSIMGVVLSDTTPIGGGGGYSGWATTNVGGDGADVDTNGDGVQNGIAYFMNDAGVITLPGIDGTNTITWVNGGNIPSGDYGSATGQFWIETSSTLTAWDEVLIGDGNLTNTAGSVSYTLPAGAGKLFARLVVVPD